MFEGAKDTVEGGGMGFVKARLRLFLPRILWGETENRCLGPCPGSVSGRRNEQPNGGMHGNLKEGSSMSLED